MKFPSLAPLAAACSLAAAATTPAAVSHAGTPVVPALMAEQIVAKNLEVRGGEEAWRKVEAIIWAGHLETTRSPLPSMRFRLVEKRPNKSRFEITEPGQRSIRVFDGTGGWIMRPRQDGRPEVKRFSAEEVRFAQEASGLEGPLIDYRAKGGRVELEGTEQVDGRKNYRIGLRLASGELQKVWIDAETYLDSRYDRTAYGSNGAKGIVSVRYLGFKEVEGLALPSVVEISGAAGGKPDRMVIERVALNPKLDDREFAAAGNPRDRFSEDARAVPK